VYLAVKLTVKNLAFTIQLHSLQQSPICHERSKKTKWQIRD